MKKECCRVFMHKRTGKLYEYFPTVFGGFAITWVDMSLPEHDTPFTDDSPIIFDDDDRFKMSNYEDLGAL